jgi:hypothetical protein
MSRPLFASLALLLGTALFADDKPVVSPQPEYDCRFDDGSVVRMTLGASEVVVQTKFGKMTVPLADVKKIEMGFRYPDGMEAKVRGALDDLGSTDFRTREAAQKALVGCGEYAVPLVKAGTQSSVPEVAARCVTILKAITATLPDDQSEPAMDDVITTDEMVIRGKITSDSFAAKTRYFGDTRVKLVDVRELRPACGRFVGTFSLDAGKHAAVGWKTFFDTGLEVEKGQPLEVTATGKIDLYPQTPGKFTSGPTGGGTQVPGPGQRLVEFEGRGGGLGMPGGSGYAQTLYPSGAVYGRIGASGTLFKIGDKLTLPKAGDSGRLYLVIAPSQYGASKGEYEVKVNLGK